MCSCQMRPRLQPRLRLRREVEMVRVDFPTEDRVLACLAWARVETQTSSNSLNNQKSSKKVDIREESTDIVAHTKNTNWELQPDLPSRPIERVTHRNPMVGRARKACEQAARTWQDTGEDPDSPSEACGRTIRARRGRAEHGESPKGHGPTVDLGAWCHQRGNNRNSRFQGKVFIPSESSTARKIMEFTTREVRKRSRQQVSELFHWDTAISWRTCNFESGKPASIGQSSED